MGSTTLQQKEHQEVPDRPGKGAAAKHKPSTRRFYGRSRSEISLASSAR